MIGIYSPSGAWGDPTLATVEKGRIIVEAKVNYHLEKINALSRSDFEPAPWVEKYLSHNQGK